MLEIGFELLRRLFQERDIVFVWRVEPGGEDRATVGLLPETAIEPFTMFISAGPLWTMGAFSYSQSTLPPETSAGRYCSFAHGITAFNSEHPTGWVSTSPFSYNPDSAPTFRLALEKAGKSATFVPRAYDDRGAAPIVIGHDVWIGQNVLLKRGIRIGDGAVVAAGSVVTRDVGPFSVVGGVPAREIRRRFPDPVVRRLQELAWWRYSFTDFCDLDIRSPSLFLDGLERKLEQGDLRPYTPGAVTLAVIRRHLEALRDETRNGGDR
jgi:acetyltransferase-like isoleucine patch superfamily enzyme